MLENLGASPSNLPVLNSAGAITRHLKLTKMTTKGKIKEKKTSLITVETTDGVVNISLHKHGLQFLKMSKLAVGQEVELDIEKSDASQGYSGNAYFTQTNKVSESLIKAKELALKEINLTKLLEGL
jgi:cold shock CspA family protein